MVEGQLATMQTLRDKYILRKEPPLSEGMTQYISDLSLQRQKPRESRLHPSVALELVFLSCGGEGQPPTSSYLS